MTSLSVPYVLNFPPSLASAFQCTNHFLDLFDPWHDTVSEYAKSRGPLPDGVPAHGHIPGLLFGMSRLAKTNDLPNSVRRRMDSLADDLLEKLCCCDPAEIGANDLSKALEGYRLIKLISKGGAMLPDSVSSFIGQWCIKLREQERLRPDASSSAASVFYTLAKGCLSVPESTLDEISKLFFWGLAHTRREQASALWCYGAACSGFVHDPSRNSALGERAWITWFKYARQHIQDRVTENPTSFRKLLAAVLQVTVTFKRVYEFQQMQSVWEQAVVDELPRFKKRDLWYMNLTRKQLKMEHGVGLDSRICDFLDKAFPERSSTVES